MESKKMNLATKEKPQPWKEEAIVKTLINTNNIITQKVENVNTNLINNGGFHLLQNGVEISQEQKQFQKRWHHLPKKDNNRKNEIIELFNKKFGNSIWIGTEHNIWTDRHNIIRLKEVNFSHNTNPFATVIGGESDWYMYDSKKGKWIIDFNEINLHQLSILIHDNIKNDWKIVKEYICSWGLSLTETENILEKEEKKYKQWQVSTMSSGLRKKTIDLLKSEVEMIKHMSEFDTDNYLLNTTSGVLNLRNGDLTPHKHSHHMLKQSPIEYDKNAKCLRWEQFLNEVFNNDTELIKYIQRAVGYSLTGDMKEQIFFILNGSGSNGKSTFLDIIAMLMGDYHHSADIETFIKQYNRGIPQDLAVLKGARFVSSTEPPTGKYWDEDRIKKITGGDNLKVRYLYGRDFEYSPTYKLWFATNYKPRFQADYAFTRRVRLIQFKQTFSKANNNLDSGLKDKLKQELLGILNWAVEGAVEYFKNGLGTCKTIHNDSKAYARAQDIIQDFIEERIQTDIGHNEKEKDVYETYQCWCNASGISHPISKKELMRELESRGFHRYKPSNIMKIKDIKVLDDEGR